MNNSLKQINMDNKYYTIDNINSSIIYILEKPNLSNDINLKKNLSNLFGLSHDKLKLSKNIDNLCSKTTTSNLTYKKYARIIEYMDKLILSGKTLKYKEKINQQKEIITKISKISIYIIKYNILNHISFLNRKFMRILILMIYSNILTTENFITIMNTFLDIGINLLIKEQIIIDNNTLFKKSCLSFINDLFCALITIPRKLINENNHMKLINQLITLLDKYIFNCPYNLHLYKLDIWMKLLGNKIINIDNNCTSSCYNQIISFLVKIYRTNFQIDFIFKDIYKKSAISFDYYVNSLDFLCALFTEEQNQKAYNDFKIKSGFYIYNNIPLTLNNVQIKSKISAFSFIFSFKLTKIEKNNEDVEILNIVSNDNKIILKIILAQPKNILKIIGYKNVEWNTNIKIELNKDYLICIPQEKKNIGKKMHLYINKKKTDKISPIEFEHFISTNIEIPDFEQNLVIELGKSNFEGIFGELLLLNKKIKSKEMFHLFNLKEDYYDILTTINYKNDFTFKKKKYLNEDDPDITYFNTLKFQCLIRISPKLITKILPNQYSFIIKPYGELKYSKKKNNINLINNNNNGIKINIYNKTFCINNYIQQHGIDYLIFQLHKIKSLSEDNKSFNFYLYKTLNFLLQFIRKADDYFFPVKNKRFKAEPKFCNFYLALNSILNSKKKVFELNEKMREILLEYGALFQSKKAIFFQKMNFDILFDSRLFKTGVYTNYKKIFEQMIWHLNNNNKDNSIMLFFKILLFDDFLLTESKDTEIKHKQYMDIISTYISENKKLKHKKMINDFLIHYLINIKNPKKIYHYLKIIYYNIDNIKEIYKESSEIFNYLITNYNKLDNYNCKYCRNNQILCFLLYDIIFNVNEGFNYTPYGFMKNPNYNFIRCLFIKYFKLNNNQKLNFIKSTLFYENEFDLITKKILPSNDSNIFSLVDYDYFIPNLNSILKYYCFLYNEYLVNKDANIFKLIKKSIKLILDFLDKIIKTYKFEDNNDNNNTGNEIKQHLGNDFIEELFTCSGIKLLFILYFYIFSEAELKDLKNLEKYIFFSINTIYNPFYFYLLLPFVDLNADKRSSKYYKSEILKMIITNIILANNTFKINSTNTGNHKSSNEILILNSIIILIRIYNMINNNEKVVVMFKTEKSIYIYIKYILENNFFYSKYIFNIDLKDENVIVNEQKSKSISIKEKLKKKHLIKRQTINKFLPEITLDIIFYLLSKKKDSDLLTLLYNNLNLKNNYSIFFDIDDYFMSESGINKNISIYNNNIVQLLNCPKICTEYCYAINANSILFSVYFFTYFFNKYKIYYNNAKINSENKNAIIDLNNQALEILLKDSISIYLKYIKKIKKNKIKIASNQLQFKIYYIIFDHFSSKYKESKFLINEGSKIFSYFDNFLKNSKEMHKIERNKKNSIATYLSMDNYSCLDRSDPSINFLASYHIRKTSYIPDEVLLFQINEKENENNYIQNIVKKLRSFSDDFEYEKKLNKYNKKIINENEINSNDNNNNSINNNSTNNNNTNNNTKIKTPKLKTKESKKYLDTDNTSFTSNYIYGFELNSESNSDYSFYDNLLACSNYRCNNFINYTEEKQKRRKNAFYLNSKKFKSSICLNVNIPSSNKSEIESSESSFKEEKQIRKDKYSIDDTKHIENKIMNSIKNNIEGEIKDSDINEEEDNHKYIIHKLDENDMSLYYYKELAQKEEPKWTRILLNPKREIMRLFGFSFRKLIYNNNNFKKLKACFKIKFKNKKLERSIPEEEHYSLNYPTKLKNFTCIDYYRPFLKPILNYFDSEYFYYSHPFIQKSIIEKEREKNEKDDIGKIEYDKIYLTIKKKKKNNKSEKEEDISEFRIKCENISNKGSIFGTLFFHNSLMVFIDSSEKDNRGLKDNYKDILYYLFSSEVTDRLKGKNKYIIIYYSEIKEIILRRYCFLDIAYEIFLKDNRSYFFNFFNAENTKKFYTNLKTKINKRNLLKKEKTKNAVNISYIKLIDDPFNNSPKAYFEKNDLKGSYVKGEITNFQYLLLVNKFSSRTYNDNNQYLIFPLLYMDLKGKIERNLSKPICLNKKLTNEDYAKFKSNFETMGYHFNSHYTTMAYIIYYLMRLIPFTNCQIKLQSGHFDAPARMFTSLENLLCVFQISDENRELCPEFFYSYESFLNLNYNDFGFINLDKRQIHNFNTSQNIGIVEFIINLRNYLEKRELSPWLNNIFGYRQISDNYESLNGFPTYSYEQYNDLEEEKREIEDDINNKVKKEIYDEKIKIIQNKIDLLSLGLVPAQLFKGAHPNKEIIKYKQLNNNNTIKLENNKKIESSKNLLRLKKQFNINKYLKEFINKGFKNLSYAFTYLNYNEIIKLIFIHENQIKIFNYLSESGKDISNINIDLEEELNILKIKPYKNLIVELYQNIYIICRLINRTLLICSEKQKCYIEWPYIITAIEFYYHFKSAINQNSEFHINKLIIGDEEGYLSIIEIITEYFDKKKEFKIIGLSNSFKRNKIYDSYINAITYNKRLDIIISSCGKGYITINNGFSFEILNIIKVGKNLNILEYKLSKYDLLYIYTNKNINNKCIYEFYCYTLNGLKIKKLDIKKEIANFYINNTSIYIIYRDGNIEEYNCANFKQIENHIKKDEIKNINSFGDVCHSVCSPKMTTIFIIFNKQFKNIQLYNNQ